MKYEPYAIRVLEDAKIYLDRMDAELYKTPVPILSGSSIGQHTRHFIEFFQCLIHQSKSEGGIINYDLRLRNKNIEDFPFIASQAIDEIIEELERGPSKTAIEIQASYHTDTPIGTSTCYDRELMYNIEHAIHHLAIVKIGLQLLTPEIKLPEHFGVAASTVKYRETLEKKQKDNLETHS